MNSESISIVCCVGSEQGGLRFGLGVPRNESLLWLKKVIHDAIGLNVLPEKVSLRYEVANGITMTLLDTRTLSSTFETPRPFFAKLGNDVVYRVVPVVEKIGNLPKDLLPVTRPLILSVKDLCKWDEEDLEKHNGGEFLDIPFELALRLQAPLRLGLDPNTIHGLGEVYPLLEKCFNQEHGQVVINKYEEVRLVGEICTKVVAGAQHLERVAASSSQIATFFIGSFIHGLFGKFTRGPDNQNLVVVEGPLEYRESTAWGIPLLPIELPSVSEGDCRSYKPKSDFSVSYWPNGCPCLIGEVVSDKLKEEDRWRMLVQGTAIARAGQVLIEPYSEDKFVLMAIYVSAKLVATRYLLRADGHKVYIYQEHYKLTDENHVVALLLELFNWRAHVIRVASNLKAYEKLSKLNQYADGLHKLSTKEVMLVE